MPRFFIVQADLSIEYTDDEDIAAFASRDPFYTVIDTELLRTTSAGETEEITPAHKEDFE